MFMVLRRLSVYGPCYISHHPYEARATHERQNQHRGRFHTIVSRLETVGLEKKRKMMIAFISGTLFGSRYGALVIGGQGQALGNSFLCASAAHVEMALHSPPSRVGAHFSPTATRHQLGDTRRYRRHVHTRHTTHARTASLRASTAHRQDDIYLRAYACS